MKKGLYLNTLLHVKSCDKMKGKSLLASSCRLYLHPIDLHARVTLAVGLTFSLVSTPGRVNLPTQDNFLIVSRPFECDRALSCFRC